MTDQHAGTNKPVYACNLCGNLAHLRGDTRCIEHAIMELREAVGKLNTIISAWDEMLQARGLSGANDGV